MALHNRTGNYADWNKNMPSGNSALNIGDDIIRSDKSIIEAAFDREHSFNSTSAASAGQHRIGSARIYAGTQSQISTAGADSAGRLMYTTDTERLHYIGTSKTTGLQRFRGAIVEDSGGTTVVSGSFVKLEYDNVRLDRGDYFDASVDSTAFVVPSNDSGVFGLSGGFDVANASGLTGNVRLSISRGTQTVAHGEYEQSDTSVGGMSIYGIDFANSGASYIMQFEHNSGANKTIIPRFAIHRLGT